MGLFLIDKVKVNQSKFEDTTKAISNKLGIPNPDDLMSVMYLESGLDSTIENTKFPFKNGNATGLIQFTPDTAIYLGTTVKELKQMPNYNQLLYVLKYLAPYKNKLKNVYDIYSAIFFPAAIGKPDNYIFSTSKLSASKVAQNNPAFDLDKDGKISMKEFKNAIDAKLAKLGRTPPKRSFSLNTTFKTLGIISGIVIANKLILER